MYFLQQINRTDIYQPCRLTKKFEHVLTVPVSCFLFTPKDIFSPFEISRGEIFNILLNMHAHRRC